MLQTLTMAPACSKPCHCWEEASESVSKPPLALPLNGGGHPTAASLVRRTPLREVRRASCHQE